MMRSSNLLTSFKHAFAGLWYVMRTQRNMRIHLLVMGGTVFAGLWLGLRLTEWAILTLTISMVLTAEAFNTMAEAVVDLATGEYHPLAKVAKDAAAAGVLLTAIAAVIVGLLILGPPLWQVARGIFNIL